MTIFTGIRPSGKLHLGNYFGAIKQIARLQEDNKCICSVVDLHAITTEYEKEELRELIYENTASWIAGGVDPEKTTLFLQSRVSAHAELMWLLNTITPVGKLKRMIQYKEKAKKQESPKAGLLNYPILQAADILLYDAKKVPIGADQKQHLELARDLAQKFNNRFGETFEVPEAMIGDSGSKIMSLQDPESKMSKSEPTGCLYLSDTSDEIKDKIMNAVTDSGSEIKAAPSKAGVSNLLELYSLFSSQSVKELEVQYEDSGYAELKEDLAKLIIENLQEFRDKRENLLSNKEEIEEVLFENATEAQKQAQSKLREVKEAMGLFV